MVLDVRKGDKGRARGRGRGKKGGGGGVVTAGKMSSLLASTLGSSGGVVAGLMDSGGLGVALPCASTKCFRLFLEVFDDCSYVGRRLSLRDRAIRELHETVFAFF